MATKWRPSKTDCLYVIPDIHGASFLLQVVLKNILPLRKSDGIQDKIVFLGDYIDRGATTKKVIDLLVQLKDKYDQKVTFLMGNHELLMMEALGIGNKSLYIGTSFNDWAVNGGVNTVASYLPGKDSAREAAMMAKLYSYSIWGDKSKQELINFILSIIPESHIDFLINLQLIHKTGNYVFTHAGYDTVGGLSSNSPHDVLWDRNIYRFWKQYHIKSPINNSIINNKKEIVEEYVKKWKEIGMQSIAGHNHGGNIFISEQFTMLDAGAPKKLVVYEANSKKACVVPEGGVKMLHL